MDAARGPGLSWFTLGAPAALAVVLILIVPLLRSDHVKSPRVPAALSILYSFQAALVTSYWGWAVEVEGSGKLWIPRAVYLLSTAGVFLDIASALMRRCRFFPGREDLGARVATDSSAVALFAFPCMLLLGRPLAWSMPLFYAGLVLLRAELLAQVESAGDDDQPCDQKEKKASDPRGLGHRGGSRGHIEKICVMHALFGALGFFATGHECAFNMIDFGAAFIGFDDYDFRVGAITVALNTFCAPFLASLSLASLVPAKSKVGHRRGVFQGGLQFASRLILIAFVHVCAACLMALLHRRHLMVWAVFAPKFLFVVAFFAATLAGVIIGSVQAMFSL